MCRFFHLRAVERAINAHDSLGSCVSLVPIDISFGKAFVVAIEGGGVFIWGLITGPLSFTVEVAEDYRLVVECRIILTLKFCLIK